MTSLVIFDVEHTLVDVTLLDAVRNARDWSAYRRLVPRSALFPGIRDLLAELNARKIPWVTASNVPSQAIDALLDYHSLMPALRIAYHDVKNAKPAPDMALKALDRFKVNASDAIGVGDGDRDARCFSSAGVPAIGAGWSGFFDRNAIWSRVAARPDDVLR